MKGVNGPVFAAGNNDRGIAYGQVLDEIVARIRNPFHPPDVQPDFLEDSLTFQLKLFVRGEHIRRNRAGPEMRIFIMPLIAVSRAVAVCQRSVWCCTHSIASLCWFSCSIARSCPHSLTGNGLRTDTTW